MHPSFSHRSTLPPPSSSLPGATTDGVSGAAAVVGGSLDDVFFDEDALPGAAPAYAAAYARLANAAAPDRPVLSDITDAGQYAASSIANFLQRVGGSAAP